MFCLDSPSPFLFPRPSCGAPVFNPDWFPKSPKPKALPVGLGVLFILIGAGCVAWGLHDLILAARSARWPTVPGTILSADEGEMTSESYDRERRGSKTRSRTSYAPSVSYRYEVREVRFLGERMFVGEGFHMSGKAADALMARYRVGKRWWCITMASIRSGRCWSREFGPGIGRRR